MERHHESIALLAYRYWEERGCPHGSPEVDWFRAREALGLSEPMPLAVGLLQYRTDEPLAIF